MLARHLSSIASTALVCLTLLSACGSDDGGGGGGGIGDVGKPGFISEEYFQQRAIDYYRYATQTFSAGSPLNVLCHMERQRIEADYEIPATVPADAWDSIFAKLARLDDTRDFDGLYLLNVLLGYRDHPALPAELWTKVENALITFKYWYTEPTPEGLIDNSYYWTENHQILFHTIELLMGQEYPDTLLSTDQRPGSEHHERARERILRWLDHRIRFGFTEWHSNVYYQKDVTPLLTLVEYADDEEIRTKAASILDIVIFDMALHTFRGAFGVTHGRSYKKDKMGSLDDDTWNGVKLLFDESTYDYTSMGAPDAALLGRAQRYRLPQVILQVAKSRDAFVDRERMSLEINETGPVVDDPQAPYEFSYTDPDDLVVWWGMGALTTWPVVPLTIETMEQYNLWETELFQPFSGLRAFTGDIDMAQRLAAQNARILGFGLLKEVNTYTYRTADYMLSSAIDYRKGWFSAQAHSWQATLDANALVFTTHAFRPPHKSTVWSDDTESGSYWTGEASMPRSAQHENVAVHLYAPKYPQNVPPPFEFFRYEPYTHAYFPQDHFDEVVQAPADPAGTWTFGRLGGGYVALYSYRPVEWIVYDPNEYATKGMVQPFDLRATGGANNVWIAECGREADWGSFEAFRAAVAAARVDITPQGNPNNQSTPFQVAYQSPSQGLVEFDWDNAFKVAGNEIQTAGFLRYDNPWSRTEYNTHETYIGKDGYGLELDFATVTRRAWEP
jgi:hypothetical protein